MKIFLNQRENKSIQKGLFWFWCTVKFRRMNPKYFIDCGLNNRLILALKVSKGVFLNGTTIVKIFFLNYHFQPNGQKIQFLQSYEVHRFLISSCELYCTTELRHKRKQQLSQTKFRFNIEKNWNGKGTHSWRKKTFFIRGTKEKILEKKKKITFTF